MAGCEAEHVDFATTMVHPLGTGPGNLDATLAVAQASRITRLVETDRQGPG